MGVKEETAKDLVLSIRRYTLLLMLRTKGGGE
jgi:hypothetical protein